MAIDPLSEESLLGEAKVLVDAHGGPLSEEDLLELARRTGRPVAAIRGALSFYQDFQQSTPPLTICHGTACQLRGGDGNATPSATPPCHRSYCLGYCDRSPVALLRDGHSTRVVSRVDHGRLASLPRVECLAPHAVVTGRIQPDGDPGDPDVARARGVYDALSAAVHRPPHVVIDVMERSGERGRGGAGYPTARKWSAARNAIGSQKYVIANGDEGDPGSFIDRVLMEHDPHSILEGLALAGYAVGADTGFVFVRNEYPRATETIAHAIQLARSEGLLGANLFGSNFSFDVHIFPAHGSYVCGEETALLNAMEGKRGEVRLRPPYPTTAGLHGCPTVVNNVESLVNVPWIVKNGAEAYASMGTPDSRGTKAICLGKGFSRPGIVEVAFGTSLREVVEQVGGGGYGEPIEALLIGGPMGSLVDIDDIDVPICYSALADRGIDLGHGGIVPILRSDSRRQLLTHLLGFMADESCGKCVPCRLGSADAHVRSIGPNPDFNAIRELMDLMRDTSLCAFGQLTPNPIHSLLDKLTKGDPER